MTKRYRALSVTILVVVSHAVALQTMACGRVRYRVDREDASVSRSDSALIDATLVAIETGAMEVGFDVTESAAADASLDVTAPMDGNLDARLPMDTAPDAGTPGDIGASLDVIDGQVTGVDVGLDSGSTSPIDVRTDTIPDVAADRYDAETEPCALPPVTLPSGTITIASSSGFIGGAARPRITADCSGGVVISWSRIADARVASYRGGAVDVSSVGSTLCFSHHPAIGRDGTRWFACYAGQRMILHRELDSVWSSHTLPDTFGVGISAFHATDAETAHIGVDGRFFARSALDGTWNQIGVSSFTNAATWTDQIRWVSGSSGSDEMRVEHYDDGRVVVDETFDSLPDDGGSLSLEQMRVTYGPRGARALYRTSTGIRLYDGATTRLVETSSAFSYDLAIVATTGDYVAIWSPTAGPPTYALESTGYAPTPVPGMDYPHDVVALGDRYAILGSTAGAALVLTVLP